jgi:predicted GH43/DUF377 family glycosyl hydrolase
MTLSTFPHAEFPLGPFTPYAGNPIMRPQGDTWESASVYNPAAIVKDDRVVLLYRAHAADIVSHVGLATSADGIHFDRHPEPVLSPSEDYDEFGCEDPRISEIDGTYYLTYSGWDRTSAHGARPAGFFPCRSTAATSCTSVRARSGTHGPTT